MATSAPFVYNGTLSFPPDSGLPNLGIPFGGTGNFTQVAHDVYSLTGSGTQAVGLGSIAAPGAKGILIELDNDGAAQPIAVKINASVTPMEISRGGFMAYFSPDPVAGITSLSFDYTTAVCVRVWVFG